MGETSSAKEGELTQRWACRPLVLLVAVAALMCMRMDAALHGCIPREIQQSSASLHQPTSSIILR